MRLATIALAASCMLAGGLISCSRKASTGIEIDKQLRGFILPKSKMLAGVDFERLRQSQFYVSHQAELSLPQLDEMPRQIGIDPRKDLTSFLASWDGSETLAMIRGNYDSGELQKKLASATKQEKYNRLTLYGDGKRDVVFLPKGIALAGPPTLLKTVIADDATGSGDIPEDLQLQLAKVGKDSQIWLVSTGVISSESLPIRSDTAMTLSNIANYVDGVASGLALSSGLTFDARLSCISEEGSQRVRDALKGLIGLARLSTRDDQLDQLKIWDSINVDQRGKEVHVSASLSSEMAGKLLKNMTAFNRR